MTRWRKYSALTSSRSIVGNDLAYLDTGADAHTHTHVRRQPFSRWSYTPTMTLANACTFQRET